MEYCSVNNKKPRLRLAILVSHPIQYYSPWFAYITDFIDLHVFYAYQQTPEGNPKRAFLQSLTGIYHF